MVDIAQVAFNRGEISPMAAARTDQQMYGSAVQSCVNFQLNAEGAASNRPGLQLIGTSLSNTPGGSYLVPFIFNNEQTYVIEFSAGAMQLYSQGAFVQNAIDVIITNVTVSFGLHVTTMVFTGSNTYSAGVQVNISGVNYNGTWNVNRTWTVTSATPSDFTVVVPGFGIGSFTYIGGGLSGQNLNLTNPYALADLPHLRWAQSADVLSLVVGTQPMYQLKRLNVNSFTFSAPTLLFGPFQEINTDGTTTVYASATQGTVTLTASAPIFKAAHVGALFMLQEQFLDSIAEWEAQKILVKGGTPVGTYIRSDNKVYLCVDYNTSTGDTTFATGTFQPVHTSGTQTDGNGSGVPGLGSCGVSWQFVSTDTGIAQITQYIDPMHVKAVVQSNKGIYSNFSPTVVGGPQTVVGPFTFNGDGSTAIFSPLTAITTANPNQFYVTVDGIFQDPSTYSINLTGTSITFNTPPDTGTGNISVTQVEGTLQNIYNTVSGVPQPLTGLCLSTYWAFGSISAVQGYPSDVCYYNDRLMLSGTPQQPQTLWTSQTSDYLNFGVSDPQVDSDAITETINARQQNPINNLLPMNNLLLGTASTSWRVTDSSGIGSITPSNVAVVPQEFYGMADVPAVQTGTTIIYTQWGGRKLRDIIYNFYNDKFQGKELTVFARQIFPYGTECVRTAYAPEPAGILYAVRSDGVLCVCTYLPEQEVLAWSRYITQGNFEDVCIVPENNSYSVYVLVGRTLNGTYQRFIERFASREYATIQDAFFVDCGLTYDGRNTSITTMVLSGGTTWLANDTGTLTASSSNGWAGFQLSDSTLNNAIWLYQNVVFNGNVSASRGGYLVSPIAPGVYTIAFADGQSRSMTVDVDGITCTWGMRLAPGYLTQGTICCRVRITQVLSPVLASVQFLDPVPIALQNTAILQWTFARTQFTGFSTLANQTVSVFADGSVLPQQTVDQFGNLTFPNACGVVHAGLPYVSQLQGLNFNQQNGPEIRNHQKTVPRVAVVVDESMPFEMGPDFFNLSPVVSRQFESYTQPVQPYTGLISARLETIPDEDACVCLQMSDPAPVRILSWIADVDIGEAD